MPVEISPPPQCSTWSLVIATLNRAVELKTAITFALTQTRSPKEIIIVDASSNWLDTRAEIAALFDLRTDISLVYLRAAERSLAAQRNQGILAASSDIVFLFDDDSFMYPECAAEIMRIYDADKKRTLAGVQAVLAALPPPGSLPFDDAIDRKATGGQTGFSKRILDTAFFRWVWRELFLMDSERLFIPYTPPFPTTEVSAELRHLDINPARLLHGCRMTFRREIVLTEPFEALFLSYCPGEDLDCSYRASRHGALVTSERAQLYHYESANSRIDRYKVSLLQALNQAFCIRRHANDLERSRSSYYALMRRRLLAEFLKDGLSRRFAFPQFRGLAAAFRRSAQIFKMTDDELTRSYPEMQRQILQQ